MTERNFETLLYRQENGVAYVTLNRPKQLNAFNAKMCDELRTLWRGLRPDTSVRCVVLSAAGEKAFCTGVDRSEVNVDYADQLASGESAGSEGVGGFASPFMLDDPGAQVGPKSNDYWKPVIAAVNGMACGGAFYMLGESDFIIAADHATFFDPHVTYGMPTVFEPIHMMQKMPFHEIMRISLLGNAERMSAKRAHEIGLVTEVVPGAELEAAATWSAEIIAGYDTSAIQATVRALWSGLEVGRSQALHQGYSSIALGQTAEGLKAGQEAFTSGQRMQWRLR
jgi:enoyl-CoA hydratase/carnithine racemase